MKPIAIALIGCLLCACSAKTPTQTATDAAIQAIDALEQSITPECKTASVDKQITALRTQVENTVTYCEQEKRELQLEKDRLEIILFFLVVAMGFYITRKIINV